MLADLDAQLSEAALQVAHWERWQRRLDGLAAEEQATTATVTQLHEQATREETDVARLEGARGRELCIGIDGFARFADYFFDSLIVDWVVQNRISESLTAVQRTRSQVSSLLEGLRRRLPETREDLVEAGRRRREFIAGFKE